MPVTCASDPVIGVDSSISRPLPAGGPSKISVNTTSASSISTIRCAVVDPTNPPPTTVTFFRLIVLSFGVRWLSPRFYGPTHPPNLNITQPNQNCHPDRRPNAFCWAGAEGSASPLVLLLTGRRSLASGHFSYLPAANPTIFSIMADANADVPNFVPP